MSSDFKPGDAVAQQVQRIPRSGIREFFDLVQGRRDIISLGVGEPDFVTPPGTEAMDAARLAWERSAREDLHMGRTSRDDSRDASRIAPHQGSISRRAGATTTTSITRISTATTVHLWVSVRAAGS